MLKKDIRLGVVYAYQRGTYYDPQPLVFLSTELHRSVRRRKTGEPWCEPARPGETRPESGSGWDGTDVGYPVIMLGGGRRPLAADVLERMAALGPELIGAPLPDDLAEDFGTDILTRMARITGVYADVVAARAAEQAQAGRERAAEQQESDARRARAAAVLRVFRAAGLGDGDLATEDDGLVVTMTIEAAEKLAALLDSAPPSPAQTEGEG